VFTEKELFGSPELTPLGFLFVGTDEERSLHKANTADEFLARILDAADA